MYFTENNKLLSSDRILTLRPMEGKNTVATNGLVDTRLFTGENKLHAVKDEYHLWSLKYDFGILPQPLKQQFTSFPRLFDFVQRYFKTRNIEVTEVET